jgi:hypothetical protein
MIYINRVSYHHSRLYRPIGVFSVRYEYYLHIKNEILAANPEVLGSIPGAARFSE